MEYVANAAAFLVRVGHVYCSYWPFISAWYAILHMHTYLSSQGHTPQSKKIRILRQFVCQHFIFYLRDEAHQVIDVLLERHPQSYEPCWVDSLVSGRDAD